MKIGNIQGGDNPFLKKADGLNGLNQGADNKANEIKENGLEKIGAPEKVDKTKDIEKAASANSVDNQNAKLDKTQFTNENDIQEIDMQEFEDDFQ